MWTDPSDYMHAVQSWWSNHQSSSSVAPLISKRSTFQTILCQNIWGIFLLPDLSFEHLGLWLPPPTPTNTRPFHSTIDNTVETGQTMFRLQGDTKLPSQLESSLPRRPHAAPIRRHIHFPQPSEISIIPIPQIRTWWFGTTQGRCCHGRGVEKRYSETETGLHLAGGPGDKQKGCVQHKECIIALIIFSFQGAEDV